MESGSFADFMSQMPVELTRLFFIFLILLIMTIVGYVLIKRRETNQANQRIAGGGGLPPNQPPSAAFTTPTTDIPDIDTLLAMTDPVKTASPTPATNTRQAGLVNIRLASGEVVEGAEMLILLRERQTNRLVVQIGDEAYTGTEDRINPEFRRRFVTLMKELSGVAPQLGRGAKAAAAPQQAPATSPAVTNTEPVASGSVAEQIEHHLQAHLRQTGAFAGRSIHVKDATDGGVRIEVDGAYFDSVGAITDPDIKRAIKKAVATWQESSNRDN